MTTSFPSLCTGWLVAGILAAGMLLSACARAPINLQRGTLLHDGIERSYWLFVPEATDTQEPMPLVLALHRFTGSGAEMANTSRFHEVAAVEGFVVAYPDGRGRRWNTEPNTSPDDAGFLLALIDALADTYPIDEKRVYVTGASNGGFMTWLLACQARDRFAAVAPVMATFPRAIAEECLPGPMPVCIVHGTDDPIVPFASAELGGGPGTLRSVLPIPEAVDFWVARNAATTIPVLTPLPDIAPDDGTTTIEVRYPNAVTGAEVVLYRVEAGGHTWPGGGESWPRFLVGNQSQDFRASEVIWDFFSRHALP